MGEREARRYESKRGSEREREKGGWREIGRWRKDTLTAGGGRWRKKKKKKKKKSSSVESSRCDPV